MPTNTLHGTNIKILRDESNVNRITGEDAIAYRAANYYTLKFIEVDEPISDASAGKDLDAVEPTGKTLSKLAAKFPAPQEWNNE